MTYSLVSAAALGFELVHLPLGPDVARVLLAGLTADSETLLALASSADDSEPVLDADALLVGVPLLRSIRSGLTSSSTDDDVLAALAASRWDGAWAMDRLVRHEVLGDECAALARVPHPARGRVVDGIARLALSAWALPSRGPGTVDPKDTAAPMDHVDGWPDLGPHSDALREVLTPLLGHDREVRREWCDGPPTGAADWAAAMHRACWAAHLSGRVREAAAAQLLGVLAVRAAGREPDGATAGTWTVLSGVVQATVVRDLLDDDSLATLMASAPAYVRSAGRRTVR